MLRLFPESVPLEDLFTEAVARLFETRPELCVAWLREVGALPPGREAAGGGARVRTRLQKWLGNLDHREAASRVDLMIEVLWPPEGGAAGSAAPADVVVVESKVGSREGEGQLRRCAEHLHGMEGYGSKALLYVTRGYDPKEASRSLRGCERQVPRMGREAGSRARTRRGPPKDRVGTQRTPRAFPAVPAVLREGLRGIA
jgi:hypothetical protein